MDGKSWNEQMQVFKIVRMNRELERLRHERMDTPTYGIHVPYCSIENVLGMATKVSAYEYSATYVAENDSRYWLSRSLATKRNRSTCESEKQLLSNGV